MFGPCSRDYTLTEPRVMSRLAIVSSRRQFTSSEPYPASSRGVHFLGLRVVEWHFAPLRIVPRFFTSSYTSKTKIVQSLQLGVLRFGFFQNRYIGVGVFPESQKLLICGPG